MTLVLDSIEDKRAFSIVGIVKDKLRKKIELTLASLSVDVYTKVLHTENFPIPKGY